MASRHRKQRFPRADKRRNSSCLQSSSSFSEADCESDDEPYFSTNKRFRDPYTQRTSLRQPKPVERNDCKDLNPTSRLDKRARDEHNEQERSRRRELAVIYELIRCSFSEDDLRYLEPGNNAKSIDKLSYPQVLQIAYHLVREEHHNLQLYEKVLTDIKRIEKELIRLGLPVPQRPPCPPVTETHRKVAMIVDGLLKTDKSARAVDGTYEITPSQRATVGDHQLSFLRTKLFHSSTANMRTYPSASRPARATCPLTERRYQPVPSVAIRSHMENDQPLLRYEVKSSPIASGWNGADTPLVGSEDDIISARTLHHSSSAASFDCLDDIDFPPASENLPEDEICLFDSTSNGAFVEEDDIFPDFPF